MKLESISQRLVRDVEKLRFGAPVTHVYNPLVYARRPHKEYLKRFGAGTKEVVFVGMNPGPWGMAQTGIPFGEVAVVRDWMGIEAKVEKPTHEHAKRPVDGFACTRSEVSGKRLWGWAQDRVGSADTFFARFFVWNYCPLSFMEEGGRNRTPNKLPRDERVPLFEACDAALTQIVATLKPTYVIGVGKFAEDRCHAALGDSSLVIGRMLHPSPASPAANKNWAKSAEANLAQYGIEI